MDSKTSWIIGADPACDLIIDLPSVSRRHCRLSRGARDTFTVVDLGSTNGTAVNVQGRRVSSAAIAPGDVLYFGPVAVAAEEFLGRPETSAPAAPDPFFASPAVLAGLGLLLQAILLAGMVLALRRWSN